MNIYSITLDIIFKRCIIGYIMIITSMTFLSGGISKWIKRILKR